MTLQEILAQLLNPGGSQQAAPQMGGQPMVTPVGDHALMAQQRLGGGQSQQLPPQMPQQQQLPPQAPQGQPMQQPDPRGSPQPQGGGLGGIGQLIQSILGPRQVAPQNSATIGWLTSQGLDPGSATIIASDKTALRSYVTDRVKGKESVFDQRAAAAQAAGLDMSTKEGRNYFLTGNIDKPEDATPDSVRALDERAKRAGLQPGTKPYNDFMVSGGSGPGVNVNLPGTPNIGPISPGWSATQDPTTGKWSMEPMAGGPADTSKVDATKFDQATQASDVIVNAAGKIRTLAKEPGATGLVGAAASYLPGSPAAEVYRQVDVLKSNATISNLNAMRSASATGGALGNVTEGEGKMLAAKSGALDPKSPYFQEQLDDYERTLLRVVHGKDAGDKIFEATRNAQDQPPPPVGAPGGPAAETPAGQRVIQQMTNPAPVVDWKDFFGKKAR